MINDCLKECWSYSALIDSFKIPIYLMKLLSMVDRAPFTLKNRVCCIPVQKNDCANVPPSTRQFGDKVPQFFDMIWLPLTV